MARKTKEDTEQTRLHILDSALNTFCELGYSKTTFDEIAHRINLTKGAIYWHFKNKPELVAAMITEAFERANALVIKEVPDIKNLNDLKKSMILRAQIIQDDPTHHKLLFFVMFQIEWSENFYTQIEQTIKHICEHSQKQIFNALFNAQKGGEIAKNIDIHTLSAIISSLWDGLLRNEILHKSDDSIKFSTLIEQGFDLIIRGITK